jgi:cell division protein ZapA
LARADDPVRPPGAVSGDERSASDAERPVRQIRTVDIFGRRYKIETEHDPETIRALASYLDRRIRAISQRTDPGDVVGAAVLAALNIADDYYQTRRALEQREEDITERARELVDRIDRALGQVDQSRTTNSDE